jgi:CHAD domain-containing protein
MTTTTTARPAPRTRTKDRPATTSAPTAGEVVLQALRARTKALKKAERTIRNGDHDAVELIRIAARQLRSILRGFSRVLDGKSTRALCAELAWLGRELGEENDIQVTIEELRRQHKAVPQELIVGPVLDDARSTLDQHAVRVSRTTGAALDSARYTALRQELDRLLADPPVTERATRPAVEELPKNIARAMRRFDRQLVAALELSPGSERDEALHDARKADKQLRYVTDIAAPVLGARAHRLARQAKKLQDLLGDYHDAVVTRPLVYELGVAAANNGHPTSTYYLADALERIRAERVLEKLPRRLAKLYDAAAWLPKADTLRYNPQTSSVRISSVG